MVVITVGFLSLLTCLFFTTFVIASFFFYETELVVRLVKLPLSRDKVLALNTVGGTINLRERAFAISF